MNRMPAISNEVPIGKRIKGAEMLSIIFPKAGSHARAHEGAFPQPCPAVRPRMKSETACWPAAYRSRGGLRTETPVSSFNLRPIAGSIRSGTPTPVRFINVARNLVLSADPGFPSAYAWSATTLNVVRGGVSYKF